MYDSVCQYNYSSVIGHKIWVLHKVHHGKFLIFYTKWRNCVLLIIAEFCIRMLVKEKKIYIPTELTLVYSRYNLECTYVVCW